MRVPLLIRLGATLWTAILIVVYWRAYGPVNFLWFSDISLFLLTLNLWLNHRLIASVVAVLVIVPEAVWLIDFVAAAVGIGSFGMAQYMFESDRPLYLRAISLFHLWMPPLALWHVWRLGYDRRACWIAIALAAVVLPITRLASTPDENVNWVYGLGTRQTWVSDWIYMVALFAFFVVCFFQPAHRLMIWMDSKRARSADAP